MLIDSYKWKLDQINADKNDFYTIEVKKVGDTYKVYQKKQFPLTSTYASFEAVIFFTENSIRIKIALKVEVLYYVIVMYTVVVGFTIFLVTNGSFAFLGFVLILLISLASFFIQKKSFKNYILKILNTDL